MIISFWAMTPCSLVDRCINVSEKRAASIFRITYRQTITLILNMVRILNLLFLCFKVLLWQGEGGQISDAAETCCHGSFTTCRTGLPSWWSPISCSTNTISLPSISKLWYYMDLSLVSEIRGHVWLLFLFTHIYLLQQVDRLYLLTQNLEPFSWWCRYADI